MKAKLKKLLAGTRALESRLTAAVERRTQRVIRVAPTQPLELIEAVADEIVSHVQAAGRGRYTFPFNSVRITFVAPTAEDRARFDAYCAGPPSIDDRIVRRLRAAGCEVTAADVDVTVVYAEAAESTWARPYHLALARVDDADRPAQPSLAAVTAVNLVVTQGFAGEREYTLAAFPINVGRGAEVRDSRNQLVRLNDVVFSEIDDEVNRSVSRRHARIDLDARTGAVRVIDDNSAQGTSVIRRGRGLAVPRGSRGLVVQTGDEISFGQAKARIVITRT